MDEGEEENTNLEGEDNEDENGILVENVGVCIFLTALEKKNPKKSKLLVCEKEPVLVVLKY